jgi:hypothetical protein
LPQYLVVWLRFLISPPENDGILTNQVWCLVHDLLIV